MRALPLIGVLAGVALAGCGAPATDDSSGSFQGEQRLVANAVEDFESATAKRDEGEICRERLARALVGRLGGASGCPGRVQAALDDADASGLTVTRVRLQGSTATATVRQDAGNADRPGTIRLVRERGGWRIADFGP